MASYNSLLGHHLEQGGSEGAREEGEGERELTGNSVADVDTSFSTRRMPKGSILKKVDAAWYVFDDISCDQAEDFLRRHGDDGTYLVAHFHDPESYGLSIRISEGEDIVYKHYAIVISNGEYQIDGVAGSYNSIEDAVDVIAEKMKPKTLTPIFHAYNCETCEYSISFSAEEPPDYKEAERFPTAARKPLPLIIPIRPTLHRMMGSTRVDHSLSRQQHTATEQQEQQQRGSCWRLFHTDPAGGWYKPHKAGPITAVILVVGWILFLLLFGWIVALALVLVFILVVFAYILNFICTGRCQIDDNDSSTANASGTA